MTIFYIQNYMLIIIGILLLICYSFFIKKPKDGFELPPSPPSLPIIGHLHLLLSSLTHKSLQKLSSKYGALLHLRSLKKLGISLFKKEIMDVSCRFDEVLERILEEHEEKLKEDQDMDLVDMLLAAYRDKNAEYKFTRNHIKSLFVDILVAGTDTSRHATQWTMAEIINNPRVLERLREEIDSVVGKTRLIQETDIPNLPYLHSVVKEGLRLHPPGALFARTSREGFRIRGVYVPENTPLVVNAYAVMRDPDSWQDPNEFRPERFLDSSRSGDEDEREHAFKYIPFGGGRRGCPGVNLAYIIVGTAIGVMVQCFDWRIKGDKLNMEEAPRALVLTMAHPLKCIPDSRTPPLFSDSQIPSS